MRRILVLLMISCNLALAGNSELDRLVEFMMNIRSGKTIKPVADDTTVTFKCGTPFIISLLENRGKIDAAILEQLIVRPTRQKRLGTEHFVLHYDTAGTNAVYHPLEDINPANGVPDYIDSAALVFEYVWSYEVDTLGFPSPPADTGGGDTRYDIYFTHLGSSIYGQTWREDAIDSRRYRSFIEMENDYQENSVYRNRPLDALKVTAAHEFFHAIHYNLDAFEYHQGKAWWYEVSSVWMEDVVYDYVNDYLYYLPFYYDRPWLGLGTYSTDPYDPARTLHPYASCVWARFLHERYDRDIMRRIWQICANVGGYNLLPATDEALGEYGSDFRSAFREFAAWNYFTAGRADTINKYSEANLWPRVRTRLSTRRTPYEYPLDTLFAEADSTPEPLAANYLVFRCSPFEPGGLLFDFDGDDLQGQIWNVAVLGWDPASDTTVLLPTDNLTGRGLLGFRDWSRYDSLVLIPTIFSLAPGYDPAGYHIVVYYDSMLVGGAPLIADLPSQISIKAGSCSTLTVTATDADGDSIILSCPDDTLEEVTFVDFGDGSGQLTFCAPKNRVGYSYNIKVLASDSTGYDAKLVNFYILAARNEVYAHIYPNPLIYGQQTAATLRYFLSEAVDVGDIDIRIFNTAGDLIFRFENIEQVVADANQPGFHYIDWDLGNSAGKSLAGGIYFIKIRAGGMSGSGKFAIIR